MTTSLFSSIILRNAKFLTWLFDLFTEQFERNSKDFIRIPATKKTPKIERLLQKAKNIKASISLAQGIALTRCTLIIVLTFNAMHYGNSTSSTRLHFQEFTTKY